MVLYLPIKPCYPGGPTDHQEIERTLISDLDTAEVRLVDSILLLGLRRQIAPKSEEWSEHHEQHTLAAVAVPEGRY